METYHSFEASDVKEMNIPLLPECTYQVRKMRLFAVRNGKFVAVWDKNNRKWAYELSVNGVSAE